MNFCGSYRPDQVTFLLKQLPKLPPIDVDQKEYLIQSGDRHYSEMLSPESLPSAKYLDVYRSAYRANLDQMARDCLALAASIANDRAGPITLVSLVRAGTPIGVILKRLLSDVFQRSVKHYSISIVRDRGIDAVAMRHILDDGCDPASIVFVDGWTGKGVISGVLDDALCKFNADHNVSISSGLYVLSDLAGTAQSAASFSDYLIPSSILNATVSGLVSRSVLNDSIGPNDFHGCVFSQEFSKEDLSQYFADGVIDRSLEMVEHQSVPAAVQIDRIQLNLISREFMQSTMAMHQITDVNLIKPGIGEATRVLLRRTPRLLILRDPEAIDVAHLKVLASEKLVSIIVDKKLPYQAVALIRSVVDA